MRRDLLRGVGVGDDGMRSLGHFRVTEPDVTDNRLAIESVEHRLADPLVLPFGGHVGVEIELVVREAAGGVVRYLNARLSLDPRDVCRFERRGIDFAIQKRVDDARLIWPDA